MERNQERGPFCQSCAMPLHKPEDFGEDEAGFRVNDYCRHCYQNGKFTEPGITMEQMIEKCVSLMAQMGIMPEAQAQPLMRSVIPRLKRWQNKQ